MHLDVITIAEVAGIVCAVAGGWIVGGFGGILLAVGAVLLYEARG